jgi:hypothetical protein
MRRGLFGLRDTEPAAGCRQSTGCPNRHESNGEGSVMPAPLPAPAQPTLHATPRMIRRPDQTLRRNSSVLLVRSIHACGSKQA